MDEASSLYVYWFMKSKSPDLILDISAANQVFFSVEAARNNLKLEFYWKKWTIMKTKDNGVMLGNVFRVKKLLNANAEILEIDKNFLPHRK